MLEEKQKKKLQELWESNNQEDYDLAMSMCRNLIDEHYINEYSLLLADAKGWSSEAAFSALYNSLIIYKKLECITVSETD